MKNRLITLMTAVLILTLTLTACNLPIAKPPIDEGQIETIAAATVSALFTQSAYQTQLAQMTQQALMTNTPIPTATPYPTVTPEFTYTPIPPTNTPILPTATPIPIPCNAAKFEGDITIKDWSVLFPGDEFTKTWRVKNVGSCSWTKDYRIYFHGGDQLDAPDAVAFSKVVNPGESINLSVDMVAPNEMGKYTGSWLLKAANGTAFGVGLNYNIPMTVNIKIEDVPDSKDPNTVYDMVKNYCDAVWRTTVGVIDCPGTGVDFKNGSITRTYNPILENGYREDEGALITVPSKGEGGYIEGRFPKRTIKSGDTFAALLSCANGQTDCLVTYELLYSVAGSNEKISLGNWTREYGDPKVKVYVDLFDLVGQQVNLYLLVTNEGSSAEDMAMWVAARITRP